MSCRVLVHQVCSKTLGTFNKCGGPQKTLSRTSAVCVSYVVETNTCLNEVRYPEAENHKRFSITISRVFQTLAHRRPVLDHCVTAGFDTKKRKRAK